MLLKFLLERDGDLLRAQKAATNYGSVEGKLFCVSEGPCRTIHSNYFLYCYRQLP